jgi:tRNA-specific 2-thiouridylase
MSGGVDSSVAAALLAGSGHEVVGATLKLWGGASDSGCCSVADVDDARRVADQLGFEHHVFNFTDAFDASVVARYVDEHVAGRTPNPCIECNRRVKFGLLLERSLRLGFDALATGHHARRVDGFRGPTLRRGTDSAKDQSYVLAVLTRAQLGHVLFPVGELTKEEVRAHARRLGLRTAAKPDSQDVCFVHSSAGRSGFLADRIPLHRADLVEASSGRVVGSVPAAELVTPGQRRGLGMGLDGRRRYALSVDVFSRRILVGSSDEATSARVDLEEVHWVDAPLAPGDRTLAQTTAHGAPAPGRWVADAFEFDVPQRLVAPGQTVAFYSVDDPETVVGAAVATSVALPARVG